MKVSDFNYSLPPELVAREPLPCREDSRLLVVHRDGRLEHRRFPDVVEYLSKETVYLNETRVLRARVPLSRSTGGKVEALLVRRTADRVWESLLDAGGKLRIGETLRLSDGTGARITAKAADRWTLEFDREPDLSRVGEPPIPPYLHRPADARDVERYQTVYATKEGAIAAPTAGLHFTPDILSRLNTRRLVLHVGTGTFKPVKTEEVEDHPMEAEFYDIPDPPSGKVVAVGTTTCRALESWARSGAPSGWTTLFIHPPFEFRVVKTLLTNFHLPKSTLLMLVSALAGRERILAAYDEAIRERYRFFSYGDAMLIL